MVKKKIMVGNSARKKSNEIADALMVSLPSERPLKKTFKTSCNERFSKPGNLIRRNAFNQNATKFRRKSIKPSPSFDKYLFSGSSKVMELKFTNCFQAHIKAFDMVG